MESNLTPANSQSLRVLADDLRDQAGQLDALADAIDRDGAGRPAAPVTPDTPAPATAAPEAPEPAQPAGEQTVASDPTAPSVGPTPAAGGDQAP